MISVVITTYNGEKYILDQLKSIYNQTLKPTEILIGDDNSTDSTLELIKKFCIDNNITYYLNDEGFINNNDKLYMRIFKNKNNIGYNKNFIKLIRKTSYEYIALSDQDDIWYKNKISIQYNLMIKKQSICVASSFDTIYKEENNNSSIKYINIKSKNLNRYSFYGMTMLFKKDYDFLLFLDNIENDMKFLYYDRIFTLYFVLKGNTYYIKTPLVYHRIHDNNVVGNNTKKIRGSMYDRIRIAKDYYNDIVYIKKYLSIINENDKKYLDRYEKFRYDRYKLLCDLNNNKSILSKIRLLFFIICNLNNYPYLKSILGDLYYIFNV